MITQKRQEEIDSATKNNPVTITPAEAAELRMRNKNQFYLDTGSKRLLLDEANTIRNLVTGANETGFSNAEIAEELGLAESTVCRILEGPPPKDHYDKALAAQTGVFAQVGTGARTTITVPAITSERLAELYGATVKDPVQITLDEMRALALANRPRFQMEVGAKKYLPPVVEKTAS